MDKKESQSESSFDTHWIIVEQKMTNALEHCVPESMDTITLEVVYIDTKKEVHSVNKVTIRFPKDSAHTITKEQLLSFSQKYKKYCSPTTQFILKDIKLFHISLSPQKIPDFVENEFDHNTFFRSYYPIQHDIVLDPSVFIFHNSSTLFLIFHEEEKPPIKYLKSALKDPSSNDRRMTKRVRIKAPRNTRRT